ncbi:MAG: hypothetical protein DRP27_09425 [Thermotogae bacterium]|nr:MAG: hypothetical protein DRP27_09425 [Thermotogota bacterium]
MYPGNRPVNLTITTSYITENPIDVPYTSHELDVNPDEDTGQVPDLIIRLHGSISFPYTRTEHYEVEEWENGTCSCHSETDVDHITITKELSDSKTFHVDNHNVTFFLKNPITREQTYIEPNIEYVLFTNRFPQKFVFFLDGIPFSVYYVYNYKLVRDSFGILKISKMSSGSDSFLIPGTGYSDKDILNYLDYHIKGKTEYQQHYYEYVFPYQIRNTTESYGILYRIKTYYNSSIIGRHQFNVVFYDLFNDPFISDVETIYTRIPLKCYYTLGQNYVNFTLRNDKNEPVVNYPIAVGIDGVERYLFTDTNGNLLIWRNVGEKAIVIRAQPNEFYRGCKRTIATVNISTDALKICLPITIIIVVIFAFSYKITGKVLPFNLLE